MTHLTDLIDSRIEAADSLMDLETEYAKLHGGNDCRECAERIDECKALVTSLDAEIGKFMSEAVMRVQLDKFVKNDWRLTEKIGFPFPQQ